MVLRASGVAHGSLYHHFEDASEVVETVLTDRFFLRATNDMDQLAHILESAPDKASWFAMIIAMTKAVHAPANSIFRMQRVQLLSYAASRPRMMGRLSQQQSELTDGFARLVIAAQQKGWLNPDIDPRAAAVLIQAIILGRIIDDISSEQIDPENWNQLLSKTIENVFGA